MIIPYYNLKSETSYIFLALGRLFKTAAITLFSIEVVWLTMSITNNSALYLSIIAMAQTIPFIVFGVYGGIKSDKWNKKRTLIFSDIVAIPILLSIPILYLMNLLSFFLLVILTVAFTICNCFSEPSFRSILPTILKRDKLKEGNALLDSIQRGASIFIPMTISLILLFTTEIHLFSVAAVAILLAFISHLFIKYEHINTKKENTDHSDFKAMKNTFSYIKHHPEISVPMFGSAICILINTGLCRVGLPLFLNTELNAGISAYSYVIGVMGAAALITSLLLGSIKKFNYQLTFIAGVFTWGLGLILIGISPNMLTIIFAVILLGVGQSAQGLTRVTLFQEKLPEHLLGKVFSTSSSLSYASDSMSLMLIPIFITLVPMTGLFSVGGGLLILFSIVGKHKFNKVDTIELNEAKKVE